MGEKPPKLPKTGPNRHFPANSAISWNRHISIASEGIIMPLAGNI